LSFDFVDVGRAASLALGAGLAFLKVQQHTEHAGAIGEFDAFLLPTWL
jgi:hypothetical protein